jgi:hypothetical protein
MLRLYELLPVGVEAGQHVARPAGAPADQATGLDRGLPIGLPPQQLVEKSSCDGDVVRGPEEILETLHV